MRSAAQRAYREMRAKQSVLNCARCGNEFPRVNFRGARRRYCDGCRPIVNREKDTNATRMRRERGKRS